MGTGWTKEGKRTCLTPGDLSHRLQQGLRSRLAYNTLTLSAEFDGRPISAAELDHLYVALSEEGWRIDKVPAKDAVLRVARRQAYHPVRQYLNHIGADQTVQPADLDRVASDYLGTRDRFSDAMLAATLIGAVARVLEPGCKFDSLCTLRGSQG